MRNVLLQAAMKLNKGRKKKKWWQATVRITAMIVVFCTTYALILPAITMEGKPECGMEAHEHVDSCYTLQKETQFQCNLAEQSVAGHSHGTLCSNASGELICPLPEIPVHAHESGCYSTEQIVTTEQVLSCELTESAGHSHATECYGTQQTLICQQPEVAGHAHGDSCYAAVQTLGCTLTEAEGHAHEDACYITEQTISCGQAEAVGHTHAGECYRAEDALICGQVEAAGHTHGETCYSTAQTTLNQEVLTCTMPVATLHEHTKACLVETEELVLTCELPAHTHNELCYPQEEEDADGQYLCGSGEHTHSGHCYSAEGTLACTIPEHTHEAACVVADLDLNADVENQQQWEQTLDQLTLTGNWPKDVLTVAESQLGYRESVKNVTLENGTLKGYTRYGDWYGIPYGDWCAMFASFCMNYAGVENVPLESGVNRWIEALTEQEMYFTSDTYTAKPGDLIFFDYDQKKDAIKEIPIDADHVGFVVEHIPATETEPAKIKTIEGNTSDKVDYVTYELDDPAIIGYGQMPVGELLILEYQGVDFSVTVKVGADAGIPETAQLVVREILQGSDEYNTYYQQSVEALIGQSVETAATEEDLNVSFARFFDITFLVDGVAVEPASPAEVQIRYTDSFTVEEGNTGVVVHFAQDGTEVLNADTNGDEANEADTFEFTQNSFSVSGTLVAAETRAVSNTATRVNFDDLDGTGNTEYIIYTRYNNRYYAIAAPASGKTGQMVEVKVAADGTVTWTQDADIRWTFVSTGTNTYDVTNENGRYLHAFYNGNGSDVGVIGTNSKGATLISEGTGANETFNVKHPSSSVYVGISGSQFQAVTNANNARDFYIAATQPSVYHVWFDGTNGGMMSYYGADETYLAVDPADNTITLPTTWKSSTKYDYTLNGWYDIKSSTYYEPGAKVTIDRHTVFYADWVAATYDVGQDNEHVVDSIDTNNFITTHVFDYNVLFNVQSLTHTGTVSATNHSETWTIVNNGEVPYNGGQNSLGFAFIDYDSDGEFSYPLGRDVTNINQGDAITPGILNEVREASGQDLLDLLFNPSTDVIGKNYVGEGNYLFQYMDSTTENYDGVHDGYYYLDARLNAASYNQSLQRFYLYDYLERTSDSDKDGGVGQYSDILPFNSPYLFEADQLDEYVDTILRPGYEYDAKDGESSYQNYNSVDDATTNYFFGIRTDIDFFLPNDSGSQDEYGNYGNISTRGEHMIFDFHGDDDVWVFVDGELVLDIGGLHGVMFGQIDFSSGTVITGKDGGTTTKQSFTELLGHNINEGTHTMSIYYMERGSSQSNCAIYFNIAPRYDLEITKEDIVSADKLNGAVFTIYNDEALTSPAQLWDSEEAHNEDMKDGSIDNAKSTFTVVDGIAKCWGISAGKTYYIYETTPPPGYPESDDIIRITLNNRGTATIETTTLHGENKVATEGFAVIKQEINETLKIVALTVTNQKEGDHTEVRVEKTWAEGSEILPQSITVYLTADGVPVGRRATLTEGNGWSYTWTGLDKYRSEGIDQEIVYEVQEVLVPGFITTQGQTRKVENYTDWIRVDQMSDSKTFLLVHNGNALTYDGRRFGWIDPETAKLDSSLAGQWSVTTDHDGFHLKNGLGYTLTYSANGFYGVNSDDVNLNQVFYYLNSRLVVHDHDVYYQFGTNGSVVSEDGLAFTLYQKEVITGFLTGITNVPVEEEDQTYVEVNKVWADGNELHAGASVTINLYADGKDTGRDLILNEENDWSGGFYDLPYYQEDGTTPVVYTVVETAVRDYTTSYSAPKELDGLPVTIWEAADNLSAGGVYRFTSGSYALAVDADGNVVSVQGDLDDANQQWEAVTYGSTIRLRNVGTQRYLAVNGTTLYTTTRQSGAVSAELTDDGYVKLDQVYLEIGSGYAGVTTNTANITNQRVTQEVDITGKPGTGYTVTNSHAYILPYTGSVGTQSLTFGGLLLLIGAAWMYICTSRRVRRKGGG